MLQIGAGKHEHGFDEPLGLLSDCHRRVEHFLGVLVRVAGEFDGKPLTAPATEALLTARRYFAQAAPRHTADEEESLFPRMTSARACEMIRRLQADHQEAERIQARIDALLDRWMRETTLSSPDAAELNAGLHKLQGLYREHIRIEDTEVFPLAATTLSAEQLAQVGREMRDRRGL
jgi:hemerythrin-like domain-containing protein